MTYLEQLRIWLDEERRSLASMEEIYDQNNLEIEKGRALSTENAIATHNYIRELIEAKRIVVQDLEQNIERLENQH
tara:strand:- start:7612 stop:7839 length:228 start_codon:yes stop_codon:yes gene_type:complete